MKQKMKLLSRRWLILSLIILTASCANLSQMLNQMNIKEPVASVKEAKITGIDFDKVNLIFGIEMGVMPDWAVFGE